MSNVLLFGSTGSIGKAILNSLLDENVFCGGRNFIPENTFDVVIWAQGANVNDTIGQLDEKHEEVMDANLTFIIKTLDTLLKNNQIKDGARLCILSSVWQDSVARTNKFSYIVSKSAISGIVRSVAVDLKNRNILINSISPGPIDNQMTRSLLTREQIEKINGFTDINDVIELVKFTCFKNKSMTGQNIVVDNGFSITIQGL
jgi:3-oxoacyl-[acyl-carrier protein] reductase